MKDILTTHEVVDRKCVKIAISPVFYVQQPLYQLRGP